MHPRDLYAAREGGAVIAVARGVWALPEADLPDPDLVAVAARAPGAVFGVLTALVMHDLTDEIPRAIHLLVPYGHHPPKIKGVPIVAYHVAPERLSQEIELRRSGDVELRITDVPRSVVDAFKHRSRIGVSVARAALVEALRRGVTTPGAVMTAAEAGGVGSVVRPFLEVLG